MLVPNTDLHSDTFLDVCLEQTGNSSDMLLGFNQATFTHVLLYQFISPTLVLVKISVRLTDFIITSTKTVVFLFCLFVCFKIKPAAEMDQLSIRLKKQPPFIWLQYQHPLLFLICGLCNLKIRYIKNIKRVSFNEMETS